MTRTQKLAKVAKENGIENIALVINQKYNTIYYRIRSIDTVIKFGRNLDRLNESGYHCHDTKGVTHRNIPNKTLVGYASLNQFDNE